MSCNNNPVGVFDSGVGGISVLAELTKVLPNEDFLYFGDSKNAPYGTKTEDEVLHLSEFCVKTLIDMGAKAIVIACNTATSAAAEALRKKYKEKLLEIEKKLMLYVPKEKHNVFTDKKF